MLPAVLVQVLACATPLPTNKAWIEVRSRNFTITSCLGEADTVELAERLELFRAAVQIFTNIRKTTAPIPTHIFAFDATGSFRAFQPERWVAGYFIPGMRANTVVLKHTGSSDPVELVFHEYTHFLVRNQNSLLYPKWFDEGFAEFMSTLNVRDGVVWVGGVPASRVKQFAYTEWLPSGKILTAERYESWPAEYKSMFYAQAWALVHYLLHGRRGEEPFTSEMGRYLDLVGAGRAEDEAFAEVFGMSSTQLDRALQRYLRKGKIVAFGLPVERIPWAKETRTRALPADESAARLGSLAIATGDGPLAQRIFETALAANPGHARAHAGLGEALASDGRWEEAEAHYRTALEIAPDDPLNELDLAKYHHARAKEETAAERRRERIASARRHYVRSSKLDPSAPETYALYGASFLLEGESPEKGLETLEHAQSLLPSDLGIRLLLGEAYVAAKREHAARPLLESVIAWSHDDQSREQARELLAEIGGPGDAGHRAGAE